MLTVDRLSFSFPGRRILDSVSVEFAPGAITCLLGGNGAGKTTFFNIVSGFLRPDAGSIRLGETDLTHRAPFRISRLGVARTFQDLRLITKLTVRENILLAFPHHPGEQLGRALLPQRLCRDRDAADNRKADALLAEYFLTGAADQPASEISCGQQKLLTLACCAAMDASLLLLDEPVAGVRRSWRPGSWPGMTRPCCYVADICDGRQEEESFGGRQSEDGLGKLEGGRPSAGDSEQRDLPVGRAVIVGVGHG